MCRIYYSLQESTWNDEAIFFLSRKVHGMNISYFSSRKVHRMYMNLFILQESKWKVKGNTVSTWNVYGKCR